MTEPVKKFVSIWGAMRKDDRYPPGKVLAKNMSEAERYRMERSLADAQKEMEQAFVLIERMREAEMGGAARQTETET